MNIIYTVHSGHYCYYFIYKITPLNLVHTEIAPFNLGSLGQHNLGSILCCIIQGGQGKYSSDQA